MTWTRSFNNRSTPAGVAELLFDEGPQFDFFQAVALLEQLGPSAADGVDSSHSENGGIAFAAPASTAFPGSAVHSIDRPEAGKGPRVTVNFMGLTGPSGVLPRHYTELAMQLQRQLKGEAKNALLDWFNLFTSRFVGKLYRAWAKCRIDRGVARRQAEQVEADPFTAALYGLVGLGFPGLRCRNRIVGPSDAAVVGGGDAPATAPGARNDEAGRLRERSTSHAEGLVVDEVRDWALLRHGNALARPQRSAAQVERMLADYFQVPVHIEQFCGQKLHLALTDRTRIGRSGRAQRLGRDAVVGSRVWNVQSRVRVRIGPLAYGVFEQFLPDESSATSRRRFRLLCRLVRLAIGLDLDFDVQLALRKDDVPKLQLRRSHPTTSPRRLGWHSWLVTKPVSRDVDDPVFAPIELG